jgi:hypothetical protein
MKNLKKTSLLYKLIFILLGIILVIGVVEITTSSDSPSIDEGEENYPVHHDCRY